MTIQSKQTRGQKAVVLYYSHKGKTARYAREIAMYLWSKGLSVSLSAVTDYDPARLGEADFLITGCWTCGWFVVGQRPHERWRNFSRGIAGRVPAGRTLLFTTYKIRTGSLFRRMREALGLTGRDEVPCLASRSGLLTEADKSRLDLFIHSSPIH